MYRKCKLQNQDYFPITFGSGLICIVILYQWSEICVCGGRISNVCRVKVQNLNYNLIKGLFKRH